MLWAAAPATKKVGAKAADLGNTFRDYLQYQQDRELQLDERADQARDRGGVSVPTLGYIYGGVTSSGNKNTIERITIQTLGNSVDSGFDVSAAADNTGCSASHATSGRC